MKNCALFIFTAILFTACLSDDEALNQAEHQAESIKVINLNQEGFRSGSIKNVVPEFTEKDTIKRKDLTDWKH